MCPVSPGVLLGRVKQAGMPVTVTPDNLVELSCRDCRYATERKMGKRPRMVLHRYNLAGVLVESQTIW